MHLGIKIDISENVQSQALREEQVKNICLEVLDGACLNLEVTLTFTQH